MKNRTWCVRVISLILVLGLTGALGAAQAEAEGGMIIFDMPVPALSRDFGDSVTVLDNGNIVITDPGYNGGWGAVYLYSPDLVQISRLTGDKTGDSVGDGGITVLANGNYVVRTTYWANESTYGLGAVTWCSQVSGCSGIVSAANSLIGSSASDNVGAVIALPNGNYLVASELWDNGDVLDAGAVTWGDGSLGTVGVVSATNSLVGSTTYDRVGRTASSGYVTVLSNGNYLVGCSSWDNGSVVDAGAVSWGNGMGGTTGPVSAANSLVGSHAADRLGDIFHPATELANGNYVVRSPNWDLDDTHQDVGAVTWGSGTTGVVGPLSPASSLVGSREGATVGESVIALTNGNYVVRSPYWEADDTASQTGAVTWGSGTTGVTGTVSAANSLVGSSLFDYVGDEVIALSNGNYVVSSPNWDLDDSTANTGAVTWGDGASGITGLVSTANSLYGNPGTSAGRGGVIALANGNYAVSTPSWSSDFTPPNIGAVTWGNGMGGTVGPISTANSLVGIETYDRVGDGGLYALTNGNFVFVTPYTWHDSPGAVTWVDGSQMTAGEVSAGNSLVGSTAQDDVGGGGVIPLTNGNYLVISPQWENGSIVDAGAVTWMDGSQAAAGVVSAANSLVGSSTSDKVGLTANAGGLTELANGNYVVSTPQWDNGAAIDAGAVTWGSGTSGISGAVSATNSLVGSSTGNQVGIRGALALASGNYLVNHTKWISATEVGAVTWGNGMGGTTGPVSAANSLVNTYVGDPTFTRFDFYLQPDGNATLHFPYRIDGISNGAVSLIACGSNITVGPVSAANSVLGSDTFAGWHMVSDYDALRSQLIVGNPIDNRVTVMRCLADSGSLLYLPLVMK